MLHQGFTKTVPIYFMAIFIASPFLFKLFRMSFSFSNSHIYYSPHKPIMIHLRKTMTFLSPRNELSQLIKVALILARSGMCDK
jgi:hypothetical protein